MPFVNNCSDIFPYKSPHRPKLYLSSSLHIILYFYVIRVLGRLLFTYLFIQLNVGKAQSSNSIKKEEMEIEKQCKRTVLKHVLIGISSKQKPATHILNGTLYNIVFKRQILDGKEEKEKK